MPCPACGSNDLWDDNLAWGCNRCDWFTTGNVVNRSSAHDYFRDVPPPATANVQRTRPFPTHDERDLRISANTQTGRKP